MIGEIIKKFRSAEKDKTFPFSEWHRKDVFERLLRDLLVNLGYNPDQFNYEDLKGIVELGIRKDLKAIVYLSSLQEKQRFLTNKISAPIDTIPDPETGKPAYEIAVVTNFDTWFFYFDGREIYAFSAERLEKEYEIIKSLLSKEAIESGKFKEVARKLLHKEDNEPLRQELNSLREKIANKILQYETNIHYLKNPDGSYNNEILNDAIIQKKKEYHAISQNIEDYIDFEKANLIRLDEFLKDSVDNFEVLSSLKVKNDNFDTLRAKIEEKELILEYGTRRKIDEYEEIDEEDEQSEIKGKYVVEWQLVGRGKIKDIEAIGFLARVLEKTKNFSKARQKSIWQKIAEVKIPEFNEKVRNGFLNFKQAIEKAKELDSEITKIDRAIDRLVYDLYGLTEDEIKVVEKSVWGEKFEEMYGKLPSKYEAIKLTGMKENG